MSDPSDQPKPSLAIPEDRLAALSPEDRRRIVTAMRLLVDVEKLCLEGKLIGADMLEGKTPGADLGMRLMEFERNLRIAGNEITKRPLRVAHAEAFRKGETKLDEDPWNMRVRTKAADARRAREERAREDRFRTTQAPPAQAVEPEEAETAAGPRP